MVKDGAGHPRGKYSKQSDTSQKLRSLCSNFFQFQWSGGEWNTVLEGVNHEDVEARRSFVICGEVW